MRPIRAIDAHVVSAGLREADLHTLARLGVERVVASLRDLPGPDLPFTAWIKAFERFVAKEPVRWRRTGIEASCLIGVPPALAPQIGFEALLHDLQPFFAAPTVAGIGPLVIDPSIADQRFVARRQLEMAAALRRPVWIAPAARSGADGLRRVLDLVQATQIDPGLVVMERVVPGLVPELVGAGVHLALEASRNRLENEQIASLVALHGASRVILTSHAGESGADLVAVPATVAGLHDAGLADDVIERVAWRNALDLIGRGRDDSRALPSTIG